MNDEILTKIDEIINILDNSEEMKKLDLLKEKLYQDTTLMKKIDKVKIENTYSDNYIALKKDILDNEYFREYKSIEKELYLLIKEINMKLNFLIKEKK